MKKSKAPSVANAHKKGRTQGVAAVAGGSESALLRRVEANLRKQAEWYRTRPGDPHAINTGLYVANLDMANAINEALSPNTSAQPAAQNP